MSSLELEDSHEAGSVTFEIGAGEGWRGVPDCYRLACFSRMFCRPGSKAKEFLDESLPVAQLSGRILSVSWRQAQVVAQDKFCPLYFVGA